MKALFWRIYFIDHEALRVTAFCSETARAAASGRRPGLSILRVERLSH